MMMEKDEFVEEAKRLYQEAYEDALVRAETAQKEMPDGTSDFDLFRVSYLEVGEWQLDYIKSMMEIIAEKVPKDHQSEALVEMLKHVSSTLSELAK